jgi:hypothetical protein
MAAPFQLLDALANADYQALKADIAAHGVRVPIELDQDGNVIDGHQRLRACQELGITDYPTVTRPVPSRADPQAPAGAGPRLPRPADSPRALADEVGGSHPLVETLRESRAQASAGETGPTQGETVGHPPPLGPRPGPLSAGAALAKAQTRVEQERAAAPYRRVERALGHLNDALEVIVLPWERFHESLGEVPPRPALPTVDEVCAAVPPSEAAHFTMRLETAYAILTTLQAAWQAHQAPPAPPPPAPPNRQALQAE